MAVFYRAIFRSTKNDLPKLYSVATRQIELDGRFFRIFPKFWRGVSSFTIIFIFRNRWKSLKVYFCRKAGDNINLSGINRILFFHVRNEGKPSFCSKPAVGCNRLKREKLAICETFGNLFYFRNFRNRNSWSENACGFSSQKCLHYIRNYFCIDETVCSLTKFFQYEYASNAFFKCFFIGPFNI